MQFDDGLYYDPFEGDDYIDIDLFPDPNPRKIYKEITLEDKIMLRKIGINIKEKLGSGNYGIVYRAEYMHFSLAKKEYDGSNYIYSMLSSLEGKECAIKYFDITRMNLWNLKNLNKEGIAMSELRHENIIELHQILYVDYGEHQRHSWGVPLKREDIVYSQQMDAAKSVPYPDAEFISDSEIVLDKGKKSCFIIMEYGELKTLKKYNYDKIKDRIVYTEEETKSIVKQLINGLKYLHENGRIHGDISSGNIILCKNNNNNNNGYILKYADFGLSDTPTGAESLTKIGDDTCNLALIFEDIFRNTQWISRIWNAAYDINKILSKRQSEWWIQIEANQWYNS